MKLNPEVKYKGVRVGEITDVRADINGMIATIRFDDTPENRTRWNRMRPDVSVRGDLIRDRLAASENHE